MPDPMTSPSQEVKPLPCPFGCGAKIVVVDDSNGGLVKHERAPGQVACPLNRQVTDLRTWNRRRELESRVSPEVAAITDADLGELATGKRTHLRVPVSPSMYVRLKLTSLPHQSMSGEWSLDTTSEAMSAPPSSAPEEATPWKRDPLGALRRDLKASFLRENGPDLLHDLEVGNRGYNEGLRTALHLVDGLEQTLGASRSSGEDQTAAATELADARQMVDRWRKSFADEDEPEEAKTFNLSSVGEGLTLAQVIDNLARSAGERGQHLRIANKRARDNRDKLAIAAEEIASLKQQVIDSALRAERIEADRTALVRGDVGRDRNGFWWVPKIQKVFSTAYEALDAYRASLSPQPAPPTAVCGIDGCLFAKGHGGQWHDDGKACWPVSAHPAEPTGAKKDEHLADITNSERNWTEDASHENGNYFNVCDRCGLAFIGHKRRVICKLCASHPAEPERETTRTDCTYPKCCSADDPKTPCGACDR